MMKRLIFCVVVCVAGVVGGVSAEREEAERAAVVGVDCNYAMEMEKAKKKWRDGAGEEVDPYVALARAGATEARIRLWVGEDGVNQTRYAIETAKRAKAAGLKPYVVIFLSEEWADYVKQPAPAAWRGLTLEKKAAEVEAYCEKVVKRFVEAGVEVDVFEIGNEIDFGICGEFEEEWKNRVNTEYMRERVWPRMVKIMKAAEAGVLKVRPGAKFVVHLTQWNNLEYCVAFWKWMEKAGVRMDYAGLSYFPSSSGKAEERGLAFLKKQAERVVKETGKRVWICETGYPSAENFGGQFAEWNRAAEGYALSEAGQAKWVADFVKLVRGDRNFAGAFYWSPEWYGGGLWDAFALFDGEGRARAALGALGAAGEAGASSPTTTRAAATMRATEAPEAAKKVRVYFGNLHSHTAVSDGAGTPEEAYAFARDVAKLDFLAVTEHNHLIGGDKATIAQREVLYAGPGAGALIPAAEKATVAGKFVGLYGQEFSTMSKGNHVNVFDVAAVIDVPNGKFDALLTWMEKNRDSTGQEAVVQLNHPGLNWPRNEIGRMQYGRDDFGDDATWVAKMGRVTSLIELLNGEPAAGDEKRRSPQMMERNYRQFLAAGFRVAPTGNQDNHKKEWGTSTDSRTGVLAKELTKASLLEALRARHVYASEDKNLEVVVTVNGRLCGDVLTKAGALDVAIHVADADEPDATYLVEAVRGKVGGSLAEVVTEARVGKNLEEGQFEAMEGVMMKEGGEFVYFRITQTSAKGVDQAWTSPVWLETDSVRRAEDGVR